jgi:hypothetical protein
MRNISPIAEFLGHETNAVDAVTVVKARNGLLFVTLLERGGQLNVDEWIPRARAFQFNFRDTPTLTG